MEEEEYTEQVIQTFTTNHEHYYEDCGINQNDLREVICSCGHGLQVSKETKVADGKLVYSV